MGILIRGFDAPKSCGHCIRVLGLQSAINCDEWKNIGGSIENYRSITCPIVEVKTPHGDLIDRDKVLYDYPLDNLAIILYADVVIPEEE